MKARIRLYLFLVGIITVISCDDFLVRAPLDSPSMDTFWNSPEEAEMWINNLYNSLGDFDDIAFEGYSDNAFPRSAGSNIANGSYEPDNSAIQNRWDYSSIRSALEFFERIDEVPNITQTQKDELSGQVRFMLAYQYYSLITLFRDVPLVTKTLNINESDIGKGSKEEVLNYIIEQLDLSIESLPIRWSNSETGRITKGAALTLKARVLLFNERWAEAADAAQEVINLNEYSLHPNFNELFLEEFNSNTNEVILARQYADGAAEHQGTDWFAPVAVTCCARTLPTPQLAASFEMIDGLPIDESPLYDPADPFANRDPRFYDTLLWHGQGMNGWVLDLSGSEYNFAITYLYFRKYLGDLQPNIRDGHKNWIIFRYADVLLMYAEAKNESTGPDASVYEALDLIRERVGMPDVDRSRYNTQASLREFIRNERRVELAGEGLRYFDIIRWRIAEDKLNISLTSMDLTQWKDAPVNEAGEFLLSVRPAETRIFNPSKHYVWPIPQDAIDRSTKLTQHPEWQ